MGTTRQSSYGAGPAGSAAADENARSASQSRPGEERRVHADRRVRYDRREMIRFESDRRTGFARRMDSDAWGLAP